MSSMFLGLAGMNGAGLVCNIGLAGMVGKTGFTGGMGGKSLIVCNCS